MADRRIAVARMSMDGADATNHGPASRRELEALKIAALSTGVRVSSAALTRLGGPDRLTVHEYATTGGIPLKVAGLDLNAPFDEWFCVDAELELDMVDDELGLIHGERLFAIDEVHPLPGYLGQVDSRGARVDEVVFTHIDRFRLSPISRGCAYDCAFCDFPGRVRLSTFEQLMEAARAAMDDPVLPVRHALISGGTPGPRDERRFGDLLVELVSALAPMIEIDVMMSASELAPDLVRRLVEAGVHGFAINIEIESTDAAQLHIRGKQRRARPFFDATVATAVELLGRDGAVRSLILPGLEPLSATLAGVEHIASLGADPVLSPFRPARGTALHQLPPVPTSLLRDVLDGSRDIVRQHGVALGPRCLPCQHNTLTFPWDVPSP
jgi:hypothetical protein